MSYPAPRIETETLTTPAGQYVPFRMIEVLGGEFDMGAEKDEVAFDWERPVHNVRVSTFWMGEFPVTQELWVAVMGDNPAYFSGMDRPVESVSWLDITKRFLPALQELTNREYRLPTEAEWEFAARGASTSLSKLPPNSKYAGGNRLEDVAWYTENSHRETKVVGLKQPNALGLYDMSGNVVEWCADHWHENYDAAPVDGSAWIDGENERHFRVFRGGAWYDSPLYCRVSYRFSAYPGYVSSDRGFRLVVSSWH